MINAEIVAEFISKNKNYCDDCLSKVLDIKPRQQINQICRKLEKDGSYHGEVGQCANCSKDKLITLEF